jgi:hypothetical protein
MIHTKEDVDALYHIFACNPKHMTIRIPCILAGGVALRVNMHASDD